MRVPTFLLLLTAVGLSGCSGKPEMRSEPIDVKGTVKLSGGASPKDLTLTFQPRQNTPPGNTKLAADGGFGLKLTPGKYTVYFDEANAKVPAYKSVPESFRTPSDANVLTVESGKELTIELK